MKRLLLEDLRTHACSGFFLNAHDSDAMGAHVVEDYSEELEYDLEHLSGDARVAYEAEYRRLIQEWLTYHSYCEDPFITDEHSVPVRKIKKQRKAADKRYWTFREWRESTLKKLGISPRPDTKWPWG